jgi:hypothetical protein
MALDLICGSRANVQRTEGRPHRTTHSIGCASDSERLRGHSFHQQCIAETTILQQWAESNEGIAPIKTHIGRRFE